MFYALVQLVMPCSVGDMHLRLILFYGAWVDALPLTSQNKPGEADIRRCKPRKITMKSTGNRGLSPISLIEQTPSALNHLHQVDARRQNLLISSRCFS